jgi:hypothetical protein
MVALGGVVGGLLGFTILMIVAEWLYVDWFSHHDLLEGVLGGVLIGLGAFAGTRLVRRLSSLRG